MSGGYFDYAYFKLDIFLETLDEGDLKFLKKETVIQILKDKIRILRTKYIMYRMEWLLSADIGEDDYLYSKEVLNFYYDSLIMGEQLYVTLKNDMVETVKVKKHNLKFDELSLDLQIEVLSAVYEELDATL